MSQVELPPEREVACACDVRLFRPVLRDHTGVNHRVTACLRCGTVTFTESIIDEPRPHDVRCVGNLVLPLPEETLAWLSAWPRVVGPAWEWRDPSFLGAAVRADDAAALEVIERAAVASQRDLAPLERLRQAGPPLAPPPPLPLQLRAFEVWWGRCQR